MYRGIIPRWRSRINRKSRPIPGLPMQLYHLSMEKMDSRNVVNKEGRAKRKAVLLSKGKNWEVHACVPFRYFNCFPFVWAHLQRASGAQKTRVARTQTQNKHFENHSSAASAAFRAFTWDSANGIVRSNPGGRSHI